MIVNPSLGSSQMYPSNYPGGLAPTIQSTINKPTSTWWSALNPTTQIRAPYPGADKSPAAAVAKAKLAYNLSLPKPVVRTPFPGADNSPAAAIAKAKMAYNIGTGQYTGPRATYPGADIYKPGTGITGVIPSYPGGRPPTAVRGIFDQQATGYPTSGNPETLAHVISDTGGVGGSTMMRLAILAALVIGGIFVVRSM